MRTPRFLFSRSKQIVPGKMFSTNIQILHDPLYFQRSYTVTPQNFQVSANYASSSTRFLPINRAISATFQLGFVTSSGMSSPLLSLCGENLTEKERPCPSRMQNSVGTRARARERRRGKASGAESKRARRMAAFLRGEGATRGPWRVAGPVGPPMRSRTRRPYGMRPSPGSWEVNYIAPSLQKLNFAKPTRCPI